MVAAPAAAKGKKAPPTTPGKYTDWKDEIDEVEIVQAFALGDYSRIVVEPLDASATPLPESSDNSYAPVKEVLADNAPAFAAGLTEGLVARKVPVEIQQAPTAEPKTLLVRGKILVMDPGSRAARYMVSFGAGAARTQLACEVIDAASGNVLLRFTQERRSGVGVGGGSYVKLLNRNLHTIGGDLALVLVAF
jgi:hypothetical protein